MNNSHYSSSFLITVVIYTLIGLLYLSFADEFVPIKKQKPQVIKIALIAPIIPKKEIKKEEPKVEKPKPKPKKKIVKKKKVIKKKIVKKVVIKKPIQKKVIPPKPKPIIKEPIVEEVIYYAPPPVIEEIIPEPIIETFVEEPIYYEPPAPIYSEVVPQEVYYEQPPQPISPMIQTAPESQQRYIINEPLPVLAPPVAVQSTAVESDLSNEKRAFKRETRDIINSNKRYPTMAKRRHIQGTVHVTFDISSSGEIFNIRTSGASTILQKAARKSVMKSSPLNIPNLLHSQFPMNNVSINIDFQLQ